MPDGVSKHREFWPLIWHERLLACVREILGPEARFLQHTDLHVGFSAIAWHRDSVNRSFAHGADWEELEEVYQILRVGIYLQSYEGSKFRLGFIKGSHRRNAEETPQQKRRAELRFKALGGLSFIFPEAQMWAPNAEWIATQPGDCIIFDSRMLHSGSYITGPKYSIFVAYGIENRHFYNHQNYYRNLRKELGYQELDEELIAHLKLADLYAENAPSYDHIPEAWTPSAMAHRVLQTFPNFPRRKTIT